MEIIGTYWGRYGDGDETIEIFEDGTFSQTFRAGTNTVYAIKGIWKFEEYTTVGGRWQTKIEANGIFEAEKISDKNEKVRVNRITFKPFMVPQAMSSDAVNTKLDVGTGQWLRNPIRIEFGPWPYHVSKIKGEGADTKK